MDKHPSDGPYELPNETAFLRQLMLYPGGFVGLIVGDGPDQWVGSYQSHWRAPSGYQGLADGQYGITLKVTPVK